MKPIFLLALLCLVGCDTERHIGVKASARLPNGQVIRLIEFLGHDYVVVSSGGIVHSPNCCRPPEGSITAPALSGFEPDKPFSGLLPGEEPTVIPASGGGYWIKTEAAGTGGYWVKVKDAPAEELKPLKYESVTNFTNYDRREYIPAKDPDYIIGYKVQTTNWPAAIIHSVTWGRGTNAVFVLKTCEALSPPPRTNGWQNAEWVYYEHRTWVESAPSDP